MNPTTLYVVPDTAAIFGRMELAVRRLRHVSSRKVAVQGFVERGVRLDDGAPAADWPTLAVLAAMCMLFAGLAF